MSDTKVRLIMAFCVFFIGAVIGYLLYPKFHPTLDVPIGVVPEHVSSTTVPDSIKKIILDLRGEVAKKPKVVTNTVYHDTGSTRIDTIEVVHSISVRGPVVQYVSYKKTTIGNYAKSDVWSFAPTPADSIRNDLTINWDTYVEERIIPVYNVKLEHEATSNLNKGIIAGLLAGAGIASQNVYLAGAGVVLATGVVILF